MEASGIESWAVILVDVLISATVLALIIFLLVPFLNQFFAEDGKAITAVSPTDIGLTVPDGDPSSVSAIFLGSAVGVTYGLRKLFKRKSKAPQKT